MSGRIRAQARTNALCAEWRSGWPGTGHESPALPVMPLTKRDHRAVVASRDPQVRPSFEGAPLSHLAGGVAAVSWVPISSSIATPVPAVPAAPLDRLAG